MAAPETAPASAPAAAAASPPLQTIKRRADFLRAARARRANTAAFGLQARARGDADGTIRVGFTCSRKVGNAVARNRAKRRLRAIARETLPREGRPGWDYVLIGRPEVTASHPYERMLADLSAALRKIHEDGKR